MTIEDPSRIARMLREPLHPFTHADVSRFFRRVQSLLEEKAVGTGDMSLRRDLEDDARRARYAYTFEPRYVWLQPAPGLYVVGPEDAPRQVHCTHKGVEAAWLALLFRDRPGFVPVSYLGSTPHSMRQLLRGQAPRWLEQRARAPLLARMARRIKVENGHIFPVFEWGDPEVRTE